MNKPLHDAIHGLAAALTRAAQSGNWQAVTELDAQVNRFLRACRPVPAELRPALDRLKEAYTHALELARTEAGRLSARIGNLSNNREGLRAYEQSRGVHDLL